MDKLESDFRNRNDGLWGVYRFKRGFGGQLKRTVGASDRVYNVGVQFFPVSDINDRVEPDDEPVLAEDRVRWKGEAIAAIIAVVIVTLACVVACSAIAIAFISNAPW